MHSHTDGKTPPRAFAHASAAHNMMSSPVVAFAKEYMVYIRRFSDSIRTDATFRLYKYSTEITKRSI